MTKPMTLITRVAAFAACMLLSFSALAASGGPAVRPPTAAHLSDEDVARLGAELDAIRDEVLASRGAKDAAYIRRVIAVQRGLEVAGRATLLAARFPAALVAGTAMLSAALRSLTPRPCCHPRQGA